jgi:hypothetical protein
MLDHSHEAIPPEQRLAYYTAKIEKFGPRIRPNHYPGKPRLRRWAWAAAHAAFKLYPELREPRDVQ